MNDSALIARLTARLDDLEAQVAIRAVMADYMRLCDRLDATTPMDKLGDLFTEDARWIGKGARYGAAATGEWMMLQTATYADGRSDLCSARLTVEFSRQTTGWRIPRFATENLFSRAVDRWDDAAPVPVPASAPTSMPPAASASQLSDSGAL